MTHCAITTSATETCVVCPELPAITAVPGQTLSDPLLGWNASARSIETQHGNCYTQFTVPAVAGVVCGLANEHVGSDPVFVQHGFYLYQSAGRSLRVVLENGAAKTSPVARAAGDVHRIERAGDVVKYLVNAAVVYTSTLPSRGSLIVVSCMYTAPDGVD